MDRALAAVPAQRVRMARTAGLQVPTVPRDRRRPGPVVLTGRALEGRALQGVRTVRVVPVRAATVPADLPVRPLAQAETVRTDPARRLAPAAARAEPAVRRGPGEPAVMARLAAGRLAPAQLQARVAMARAERTPTPSA